MDEVDLTQMEFDEAVKFLVAAGISKSQAMFIVAFLQGESEGDVIMEDDTPQEK